nr:hypothetical protein [Bacillota bacterium]
MKILDKNYTVVTPGPETNYTVTKAGTADLSKQEIAWTVTVSGIRGGKALDLTGYQFSDDLRAVGEYVEESFAVNGNSRTPATEGGILTYTFGADDADDATTPQAVVSFKTKISDADYFTAQKKTVTNAAQLMTGGGVVKTGTGTAVVAPKWIEKEGTPGNEAGSGGIYNPKDRTITWTITANQNKANLKNVVITDVMQNGLTVSSAAWQLWYETPSGHWGDPTPIDPAQVTDGRFVIGDINNQILLTIVSKVKDSDYQAGVTQYPNTASITWEGLSGPGIGTGTVEVGIGYNAITKAGILSDTYRTDRTIHWAVNVNTKGQKIPDLKVYDLLVYGKQANFTLSDDDLIGLGISKSALTAHYGQKYVEGSFSTNGALGLDITVRHITRDGNAVADLLIISFENEKVYNDTFKFDSQVVDPDIFAAANKDTTVYNTATLFSGSAKLDEALGSVNYPSRMLAKEMLDRDVSKPVLEVNSGITTDLNKGFNYEDKSVIFRLSVNADGLDLTGATNAAGETLGKATVTDTLPDGWEFVNIADETQYLVFEGTTGSAASVTATGGALDDTAKTAIGLSATLSGKTATFIFDTLDKPYVILVKAKPSDETIKGYFNSNKETTVTNSLNLHADKWTPGVGSTQQVKIKSEVLGKKADRLENGVVRWTVDYKPAELDMKGDSLTDELPVGADLRISSTGALLIDGNITVQALSLKSDGTYVTTGDALTLDPGPNGNISYDNATRKLTFKIPGDGTKAYRFEYITDITGGKGDITNKVSLYGTTAGGIDQSAVFPVKDADASATMERTGWIQITKTDGLGNALSGAEFTIFALDGTTVIRKGT